MTDGANTPDDASDAPKSAPAIVVGKKIEDMLRRRVWRVGWLN